MDKLIVAVVGGATCSSEESRLAESVGREVAQLGAVLICGGRGGVMEAACKGARAVGGLTIGVLPGTDHVEANPHIDIAIVTGMGEARNAVLALTAQAMVAVGGEYGTLSEIAFALKRGLPVAGLGTWQLADMSGPVETIFRAGSPREAVAWLFERLQAASS